MRDKISRALERAGRDPDAFTFAAQVDCGADPRPADAQLSTLRADSAQPAPTTSSWAFPATPPLTASCRWHARSPEPLLEHSFVKELLNADAWMLKAWVSGEPLSFGLMALRRVRKGRFCSTPSDGRLAGSVSGGCVEAAAAEGDRLGAP